MEQFSKDGRKLRPRRKTVAGEHGAYGEHRTAGGRRGAGEHRPNGEHRSYGEHRPYGEHKASGEHRSYGEHGTRSYGEHRPYGEHKAYGEHKPSGEHRRFEGSRPRRDSFRPRRGTGPQFNRESDEGINKMIDRRPRVDKAAFSDFDSAPTNMKDTVRLNKFIANSGVCSRREADTLIQAGVVTVNGEVVTELGVKVNIHTDDIRFNGQRLQGEEKVYIVMNKPKGFVTTASDPHAEKTVMDLIRNCPARVYPVGRLDKATTGVLMFTNDGEIAERLTHPSYNKKKIYQVILNRPLSDEDRNKILEGILLSDGSVAADELEFIDAEDHRKLGIEIHSGKNRIVRRIFESLGYDVKALDRVYFAGLTKKGLKKGEWRYLTEGEANILKMGAYV